MQLFWQAFTIMVLGMGLVFVFLFVVILAVQATAVLIRKYAPIVDLKPVTASDSTAADEDALIAVIAAALHR